MFAGGLKSELPSYFRTIVRTLEDPSPSNVTKLKEIAQRAEGVSPDWSQIARRLPDILRMNGSRVIGSNRFSERAPKLEGRSERVAHALLAVEKINTGDAGEILADLVKKWIREGVLKIEGLYVERKA